MPIGFRLEVEQEESKQVALEPGLSLRDKVWHLINMIPLVLVILSVLFCTMVLSVMRTAAIFNLPFVEAIPFLTKALIIYVVLVVLLIGVYLMARD